MIYVPLKEPPRRIRPLHVLLAVLALFLCFEAYRFAAFYYNAGAARTSLLAVRSQLDLTSLQSNEADLLTTRASIEAARSRAEDARSFAHGDPLLKVAAHIPLIGKQVRGLRVLTDAAVNASVTGLAASDVAIAFAQQEDNPELTSLQEALAFLESQEEPMADVQAGLSDLQADRKALPGGLIWPMSKASVQLDDALTQLEGLVTGYSRANAFLPQLLGYEQDRVYLVLPQNDTELFPSGGLISSYALASFSGGRLESVDLEYFGTLYDRWQTSTREYVEPPAPLKQYLKKDYSWALGEAGWYPDFAQTAQLARTFVEKGGAPPTDGTIAIDLHFTRALIGLLGPVDVPAYDVTVTPENLAELTTQLTRDDGYEYGSQHESFLSYLAQATITRLFSAPKEQWIDLLRLLDQQARERHLQLNFQDERLQALSAEYGLDGRIEPLNGDYLMLADTSVHSTKLNLILQTELALRVDLREDGSARSSLAYTIANPFPDWAANRDPAYVYKIMFGGVYGCYLRLYAPEQARLIDLSVNGEHAGAEQSGIELGRRVFGRFFPVLPGKTATTEFTYETPRVVETEGDTRYYRLYVQKQAGTGAFPLSIDLSLPKGADLAEIRIDGKPAGKSTQLTTDLRTDRVIEVIYRN